MRLIEKWKKRETKKKLREENGRLLAQVEALQRLRQPSICTVQRNIQLVQVNEAVSLERAYLPEEYIKEDLARCLAGELKPFIEYDFQNGFNGGKIYTAKLYVATGDKRHGE